MKKPYKPLLQSLSESRNLYQQLTGTSNKKTFNETTEYGPGCGACTSHFRAWCTENGGDCHSCDGGGFVCHNGESVIPWPKRSDRKEPTGPTIAESLKKKIINMNEQTNPFAGGGTGPNWAAAEAAWNQWNAATQTGVPGTQDLLNVDDTFLNNMQDKSCNFYQSRLTAQVNSFINQFGGSFGSASNSSNAPNAGSNPAWQSQKYARIMWLANEVQNCAGSGNNTTSSQGTTCFYNFINDTANDGVLTGAQCANGNQALTPQHIEQTKFRHQSISECSMLVDKIDEMAAQIPTLTGCAVIRKQAKHDYLVSLKNSCC